MKKQLLISLVSWLVFAATHPAQAQKYLDTNYVQDLGNRLLVSYFQEYRSLEINVQPGQSLDSTGRESLKLTANAPLYSGFSIQLKGIFIDLAGNLPQSAASEAQYGKQTSNLWRIGFRTQGLLFSFNHLRYTGFYDQHFAKQQFSQNEASAFDRYQNLQTRWLNIDLKYYPKHNQFAQGMPQSFGLRQLKSKFALGYKFSYNHLNINNPDKPLFTGQLQSRNDAFTLSQSVYNGINVAVAPSFYGVLAKRFFIYGDAWLGADLGHSKNKDAKASNGQFQFNIVVPEARLLTGFQHERWLASVYYSYLNQTFRPQNFTSSVLHHTFGAIIGYRFYAPVRLLL